MYCLALDQGTTSSRAILFDQQLNVQTSHAIEFAQHYPHDGWVEHDANEILQTTLQCINHCLAHLPPNTELTIAVTNQRETTVIWDRATGQPIYNAIVWQDRRTAAYCDQLKENGAEQIVRNKTGLLLDPYFSATKVRWILDQTPNGQQDAQAGKLCFGTIDSWLIWHLTGGKEFVTDATNASRTLLYNIHSHQWDDELLALFDIPLSMLPELKDSADHFGYFSHGDNKYPINAVLGDQQAALVAQSCLLPGQMKATYGTGCFLMANTGAEPKLSEHRLLTTVAYRQNGQSQYALEGAIFVAGAGLKWLKEELGLIENYRDLDTQIDQLSPSDEVVVVPAFTGLGAPHWLPNLRGAIFGLTRNSNGNHIVLAMLESISLQTKDLIDAIAADGIACSELSIDGGMAKSLRFAQMLSSFCDVNVRIPENTEATAIGVARLALSHAQQCPLEDIRQPGEVQHIRETVDGEYLEGKIDNWRRAIKACALYHSENEIGV